MINNFITVMKVFVQYRNLSMDNDDCWNNRLTDANDDFEEWTNCRDKHTVCHFYNDPYFGNIYTQRLFRSRVECFYEVLKDVSRHYGVKEAMIENCDVTSIGCGPGSDIAAYVAFMRTDCGVSSRLNFTAIDRIGYWRDFISVLEGYAENVCIEFHNKEMNREYLQRTNCKGVCIMSYPEAVNFGDIWKSLTTIFTLIIIVDQSKQNLHFNLRKAGFEINSFEYKGSKKYAYYLAKPVFKAPIPIYTSNTFVSIPKKIETPVNYLNGSKDVSQSRLTYYTPASVPQKVPETYINHSVYNNAYKNEAKRVSQIDEINSYRRTMDLDRVTSQSKGKSITTNPPSNLNKVPDYHPPSVKSRSSVVDTKRMPRTPISREPHPGTPIHSNTNCCCIFL